MGQHQFTKPVDYTKQRQELFIGLTCLLMAALLFLAQVQTQREGLAERLSPSILRFHILANSDSENDQQIKLEIRSLVLDYLEKAMNPQTASDKDAVIAYLKENRPNIEQMIDNQLAKKGFDYSSRLELTSCYFPTRVYDNLVIPCGTYDAARIMLGKGEGHNWWCVLYPRFCFVDAACSAVPEQSRNLLQDKLSQDDYLALKDSRPDIQIRFFLFPTVTITPPSPDR